MLVYIFPKNQTTTNLIKIDRFRFNNISAILWQSVLSVSTPDYCGEDIHALEVIGKVYHIKLNQITLPHICFQLTALSG